MLVVCIPECEQGTRILAWSDSLRNHELHHVVGPLLRQHQGSNLRIVLLRGSDGEDAVLC